MLIRGTGIRNMESVEWDREALLVLPYFLGRTARHAEPPLELQV